MVYTISCYTLFLLNLLMSQFVLGDKNEEQETVPVNLTYRKGVLGMSGERQRFKVNVFGRLFLLNLTPDSRFVAPALNVERVKAKNVAAFLRGSGRAGAPRDATEYEDSAADLRGCFYTGTVNSEEDSVVAVSLCRGIQGTFITQGDEYFIQPKATGVITGKSPQVHVVKRRAFYDDRTASKMVFDQVKVVAEDNLNSTEDGKLRRAKRFVSTARYIETLVVADASMARFYGDEIKVRGKVRINAQSLHELVIK